MAETVRRRWVIGGLLVLAAVVFGAGINWGLPSHAIDSILFGSGSDAATSSLSAYRLTGVGISRLAGDMNDDPNVAADVAAHPIADRTKPVTLLENLHGATAKQLAEQGDQTMAGLLADAAAADRQYLAIRQENNEKAEQAARDKSLDLQRKVKEYLDAANQKISPQLDQIAAQDDINRARILRRYRLYSFQPDEMITFRALEMMHPDKLQFDPKLYQYGGLWIYPVGAILKAAGLVNYVTITSDSTFYLDSPEVFGKFYILARAYSALWGLVAMLAVFALVRRISGGLLLPALAAICFICMPVVVDLGHEAKPHLAGTALILLSVLAAANYVETGRWKWIIWTAIACGASVGMVLTGIVVLPVIPAMAVARRGKSGRIMTVCIVGFLIIAGVYFASNPYVAIHLLGDHRVLESNLANTRAMYTGGMSIPNAALLIAAGMSWPLAIAGVCGAIVLCVTKQNLKGIGVAISFPAACVLMQFVMVAANKPGEYARFAIFLDTALMLGAFFAVGRFVRPVALRVIVGLVLVFCAHVYSFPYERGFLADATSDNSRFKAADKIDAIRHDATQSPTLYVLAEPAPYCLPPVNLFRWRIVLLPPGGDHSSGVLVKPDDSVNIFDPGQTPISWANKTFDVVDPTVK